MFFLTLAASAAAQWVPQTSHTTASLRGLSVVSERVVWASGTGGTFLRTTDGGATWQPGVVPGAEPLDFRDVEAFDENNAVLLAAGPGDKSRLYKTSDAGLHWTLQFTNPDAKGFLDCMAFWDAQHGLVVGDPVDGTFVVLLTSDGGQHWSRVPKEKLPPALPGEGAFAASGTCVAVQGKRNAWFATANAARVFRTRDAGRSWSVASTPIASGADSTGIFSLVFWDDARGAVIGGDYQNATAAVANTAITRDGGQTWQLATSLPAGFRSGVAAVPGTRAPTLIAVGTSGSSFSPDGGVHWDALGSDGFNAVAFASPGAGWAVGAKGAIARLTGTAPGARAPSLREKP